MEQIAQNAGVSKLTLYSHFGDKEGLLVAVIKAACEQNLPPEFFQHCPEKPVRTHLLQLAEALFAISTSAESIALHCMLCSPNNPAPNLAALFWQAGPERTQQGIASLLRHWHEAGELAIENPEQAAEHLYVLIKGKIFTRQLLGLEGLPDTATAKRHVREAVDLFLRAYRP